MERQKIKFLTDKQKDIILALHKSELTSRQIAEVAQCAQSTVIRHLQKFQATGELPLSERRKATRFPCKGTTLDQSPARTTLPVNYSCGDRNYGGLSVIKKKSINEQLNYYQKPIQARLLYTKMMEVKHSPSSQMDFRSLEATNGLPNAEEDEELDTLLDGAAVKHVPASDSKPVLNGGGKYDGLEEGMEFDLLNDEFDEDPPAANDTDKKEKETENKTEDIDIFGMDLESEEEKPTEEKITNGDVTDSSSNVRDAGDDLDTLLSKINDLVEDCMEPSTGAHSRSETAKNSEEKTTSKDKICDENQVGEEDIQEEEELLEAENDVEESVVVLENEDELNSEDVSEVKSLPEISEDVSQENHDEVAESDVEIPEQEASKEVEEDIPVVVEEDITNEVESDVVEESVKSAEISEASLPEVEKEDQHEQDKISEKPTIESMDVDDDIVCLDSPLAEEEKEEEEVLSRTDVDRETSVTSPVCKEATEKQTETELCESSAEKEVEKKVSKKVVTDEIVAEHEGESLKPMCEDEEIFVLNDDDDEEDTTKEIQSEENGEVCRKSSIEQKDTSKELKTIEKKAEDVSNSVNVDEEKEKKTEAASSSDAEKVSVAKEDDDDIVCLDDSFEETDDLNRNEKTSNTQTDADEALSIGDDKAKSGSERVENLDKSLDVQITKEVTVANAEKKAKMDSSANKSEETEDVAENTKESADKSETVQATQQMDKEVSNETSSVKSPEPRKPSQVLAENDIINLDDDDEDEVIPPVEKTDDKSSGEVTANKSQGILSDNSDNARDGVEEKDDKIDPKASSEKSVTPSETNSNSSNNLLKESTVTQRAESPSEPSEQPPAKRPRLSQDEASSRNSLVSQDDTSSKLLDDDDVMEILDNEEEENKTLKRVHSSDSISSDFKKPKTDVSSTKTEDEKPPELLKEIQPAKVEPAKMEETVEKKPDEVKPLPLYPPPNFDTPKIGLSLDFLRRFKKSIHKMNKSDLEELVLQKIVEAIVHKSEFSEMRELIEKQEKIISGHRTKITELNKQFRDLEMVHNRVLKDLETKNSQFIMPVKITRAVGLQVFFPNKKYDQPMAGLSNANSQQTPSSSSLARSVSTSSSTSSIPEKAPTASPATISNLASQTSTPTSAGGSNNQQRRGCVQKLTPMRPDGPRSALANRGVTAGVVSSSTPTTVLAKDITNKSLNRQTASKSRLPYSAVGSNVSISSLPQQSHSTHPLATQSELERSKPTSTPQGIATKKTGGAGKNFPPSKRIPKSWQSEQPVPVQQSPVAASTTSSPISPMVPPQSPAANPSLAAKAPNKSVIDLTDEDDMTPTSSPKATNVTAAQKAANTAGMHRAGPYKVSVIPAAQLQQQPRPNPPKQTQPRPQNSPQLVPKSNGTAQNAVRRTPPPLSQQRYRHPAPLPNQPIHSSNPLWKLPPARPTIRISNLDSGIVISWTIEDMAKEKYAESTSYQIYAYQETSGPPLVESWRHVGDVKAMLLPMAVTLTQFQEGQRYYFAVRAVDAHNRCGPFSFAKTWS